MLNLRTLWTQTYFLYFSCLASISCCLGKSCQTWLCFFTCLCLNGTWQCRAVLSACVCTHFVLGKKNWGGKKIEAHEVNLAKKKMFRRYWQYGLSAQQRKLEGNYKAQMILLSFSVCLFPLVSPKVLLVIGDPFAYFSVKKLLLILSWYECVWMF